MELAEILKKEYKVSYICGGMDKFERAINMSDFRKSKTNILLSTDVLARGIDFQQVQLVINLDLPRTIPTYIHRIGRTGRFGRQGSAINFVTRNDVHQVENIEKIFGVDMQEMPSDLSEFL